MTFIQVPDTDWQEQASCNGLWWVFDDAVPTKEKRRMCNECPVLQQCAEWTLRQEAGLDRIHRDTFAGGMSNTERAEYSKGLAQCLRPGCNAENRHFGLCDNHNNQRLSDRFVASPATRGEAA